MKTSFQVYKKSRQLSSKEGINQTFNIRKGVFAALD